MASALLEKIFCEPPSIYSDAEKGTSVISVYSDKPWEWISPRLKVSREVGTPHCGVRAAQRAVFAFKLRVKKLRREDWAESWKRHFHPLEISPALLVKPSWSKRRARKGQAVVVLDPGLSFGTGQHPTTEFCLRQIVAAVCDRRADLRRSRTAATTKSFLDIGTGSGILAIAAVKLGYTPIEAFDFDGEAVRVARANAKKNRVDKRISLSQRDLTKSNAQAPRKFDLICANLISNLLIEQGERILTRLKPDGVLVLAGILKKEFEKVQRAYERAGLKLISSRSQREWRSGAFQFRDL